MALRIFQCCLGMVKAMESFSLGIRHMPVIEIEVMEECTANETFFIDAKPQPPGESETQERHLDTVFIGGDPPMLDVVFHLLHGLMGERGLGQLQKLCP